MFSTSRNQNQPRQARTHGVQKRATTSRISLLSSITSLSKKSAGSSSTVTQESYLRSERPSKRRSSHSTKQRSTRSISGSMQAAKRPRRSHRDSASDIDVFSYLVEEINDPFGKSTSWEAERSRISKRASVQDDPDEIETKSNSALSMNDSGYDSTSPTTYMKPRLGSLPENVFVEKYEQPHRQHFEAQALVPHHSPHSHIPPYYYEYPPPAPSFHACTLNEEQHHHAAAGIQPPISGYDLLASQLSSGDSSSPPLPAIYRRFTTLNHRLLLQLQDEIAEMEAELRRLDDADAYNRQDTPASRRADWGRLDLLGKIHMKIEFYHTAVLNIQKVRTVTSAAKPVDVDRYRAWLAEHRPIHPAEMMYLDDEGDLMSLDTIPRPLSAETSSTQHYNFTTLISLAGVWLITCVPSRLSRLTFLVLLACFTVGSQPTLLTNLDVMEAWTRMRVIALPLAFWMIVTTIC